MHLVDCKITVMRIRDCDFPTGPTHSQNPKPSDARSCRGQSELEGPKAPEGDWSQLPSTEMVYGYLRITPNFCPSSLFHPTPERVEDWRSRSEAAPTEDLIFFKDLISCIIITMRAPLVPSA